MYKKMFLKIILLFATLILLFSGISYGEDSSNKVVSKEESIYVNAKVIEVGEITEETVGTVKEKIQNVKVKILEGEYKGHTFDGKYVLNYDTEGKVLAYELNVGNTVTVQISKEKEKTVVTVMDVIRHNYIALIVILFFASIIFIGGIKGIKTILALIITVAVIFGIMVLNVYKGYSPILMSIISSFIIVIFSFAILNGINKKSLSAALGTLGGVVLSGVIAFIFGYLAKLSGGGQEESIMLSMSSNITFNLKELLFAGIVVASLGACMDVGMSISSSLDEIRRKKPDITWKELLKSGMNIGKDLIGTMTNTLILAYVGGSLNIILLFMSNNMSFVDIINKESMAAEIVSSISGSLGIIFTVPITSIIYAFLHKDKEFYVGKPESRIEGKRSLKL